MRKPRNTPAGIDAAKSFAAFEVEEATNNLDATLIEKQRRPIRVEFWAALLCLLLVV